MKKRKLLFVSTLPLLGGCAGLLGIGTDYRDGTTSESGGSGDTGGSSDTGGSGGTASGGAIGGGSGGGSSRRFLAISAGDTHACGLELDGRVTCWGGFYSDVAEEEPSGSYDAIESGYEEACALDGGYATCFGAEDTVNTPPNVAFSDLGIGVAFACGVRSDATLECWGRDAPVPPPGSFLRVAAARTFACAIDEDGTLACFGASAPTPPSGVFEELSLGRSHGCALEKTTRLVRCFGDNYDGQTDAPNGPVLAISSGGETSCILHDGGGLECFGSNTYGQLDVPSGTYASLSVGGDFGCALDGSNAIRCWGTSVWGGDVVPP